MSLAYHTFGMANLSGLKTYQTRREGESKTVRDAQRRKPGAKWTYDSCEVDDVIIRNNSTRNSVSHLTGESTASKRHNKATHKTN